VHGERPGDVRLVGPPFEHLAAHPGEGQFAGEHQAGRTRADNDYVSHA
jgi:hypothetical protein